MIPYMNLRTRIIAWLLWKLNGWSSLEDCRFECVQYPELSKMVSICRDRYYILNAKEYLRNENYE